MRSRGRRIARSAGAAEWEASRRQLERLIDAMEEPVVQDMAREGAEGAPVSG